MNPIVYYAIPIFMLTIALEYWILQKRQHKHAIGYEPKDTAASLSMGIGNVIISALFKIVTFGALLWIYEHSGWFKDYLTASTWWAWLILLFADDFCYYWFHRVSHEVRLTWCAHENHHSSQFYNLSTALRQSWTTPFYSWIFYIPLAVVGFHPLMIFTMHAFSLLYQYWIHTETIGKLGIFENFMNTPSHHRVHHGSNEQYLDKNYGGFFIIYDRLFGTYEEEKAPVEYGMVTNISTYNPLKIASHAWISLTKDVMQARGWKDKLRYVYKPPGWHPEQ